MRIANKIKYSALMVEQTPLSHRDNRTDNRIKGELIEELKKRNLISTTIHTNCRGEEIHTTECFVITEEEQKLLDWAKLTGLEIPDNRR